MTETKVHLIEMLPLAKLQLDPANIRKSGAEAKSMALAAK